jgi:Protein of unknown function (DUF1488)
MTQETSPSKRLTLEHVDRPGYETDQGIHFAMMCGDRTVRVFVTRAAILGRATDPGGSCSKRFEDGRQLFEILAREKYDASSSRPSITVTKDDLLGVLPTM